jgi:hypothetical protein
MVQSAAMVSCRGPRLPVLYKKARRAKIHQCLAGAEISKWVGRKTDVIRKTDRWTRDSQPLLVHDSGGGRTTAATMAAVALSILGKSNEPLYLREFRNGGASAARVSDEELFGLPPPVPCDGGSSRKLDRPPGAAATSRATPGEAGAIDCSVQLQFVLHAALDRFDELAGSSGYAWRAPGDTGTDAMFVGLLKPVDNLRVYGAYPSRSRDTDPTERFLTVNLLSCFVFRSDG